MQMRQLDEVIDATARAAALVILLADLDVRILCSNSALVPSTSSASAGGSRGGSGDDDEVRGGRGKRAAIDSSDAHAHRGTRTLFLIEEARQDKDTM